MLGLEDSDVLGHRLLVQSANRSSAGAALPGVAGCLRGPGPAQAAADPERVPTGSARSWLRGYRPPGTGTESRAAGAITSAGPGTTTTCGRPARVATMDECMKALKGILGDIAAHPAAAGPGPQPVLPAHRPATRSCSGG